MAEEPEEKFDLVSLKKPIAAASILVAGVGMLITIALGLVVNGAIDSAESAVSPQFGGITAILQSAQDGTDSLVSSIDGLETGLAAVPLVGAGLAESANLTQVKESAQDARRTIGDEIVKLNAAKKDAYAMLGSLRLANLLGVLALLALFTAVILNSLGSLI